MAALMGALAALTRSIGLVLVLGLAIEAIQRTREDGRPLVPRLAASAAVAMGPALYFLYWSVVHQDAMAPFEAQETWQRVFTFPLATLVQAGRYALRYGSYWLIDALVVGVVLVAVLAGIRWLRWGYLAYALASVVVLFPAFWVMARAVERRRLPQPLLVASFAGGYALLGALFINWWHVF
jgi:hypothetical protein